jgi:serine/threonine protein kinase
MGMRFLHHGLSPPLLHRDLKSPNVMIASLDAQASVVAKVTDFGLSLHLHVDELRAKESKHRRVVNPTWLAPEVLNSENETTRSDVYAFGIILYALRILSLKLCFAIMIPFHSPPRSQVRDLSSLAPV